jgi:hypothetical protein
MEGAKNNGGREEGRESFDTKLLPGDASNYSYY